MCQSLKISCADGNRTLYNQGGEMLYIKPVVRSVKIKDCLNAIYADNGICAIGYEDCPDSYSSEEPCASGYTSCSFFYRISE